MCNVLRHLWNQLFSLLKPMSGRRFHSCPACHYLGPFSVVHNRPHARCPRCGSLERHRFLYYVLSQELERKPFTGAALLVAPEPALFSLLRSKFSRVVTTDLNQPGVTVNADLQQLPFAAGAFDFLMAIHVFDEVTDDQLAISECFRVLAPGGWLIAPVPVMSCGATEELTGRRIDGKIRLAGTDYEERFIRGGFRCYARFVATAFPVASRKHQFMIYTYGEPTEAEEFSIFVKD